MMDDAMKAQMAAAEREATEAARDLAEPVKKSATEEAMSYQARVLLRDELACAYAASGLHPDEIYAAADEALKHRDQ
jgi:hypothetical protein